MEIWRRILVGVGVLLLLVGIVGYAVLLTIRVTTARVTLMCCIIVSLAFASLSFLSRNSSRTKKLHIKAFYAFSTIILSAYVNSAVFDNHNYLLVSLASSLLLLTLCLRIDDSSGWRIFLTLALRIFFRDKEYFFTLGAGFLPATKEILEWLINKPIPVKVDLEAQTGSGSANRRQEDENAVSDFDDREGSMMRMSPQQVLERVEKEVTAFKSTLIQFQKLYLEKQGSSLSASENPADPELERVLKGLEELASTVTDVVTSLEMPPELTEGSCLPARDEDAGKAENNGKPYNDQANTFPSHAHNE